MRLKKPRRLPKEVVLCPSDGAPCKMAVLKCLGRNVVTYYGPDGQEPSVRTVRACGRASIVLAPEEKVIGHYDNADDNEVGTRHWVGIAVDDAASAAIAPPYRKPLPEMLCVRADGTSVQIQGS